jgi:hypothetical protein
MHRDPELFAALLSDAASDIERQERHPGQPIPGVWVVGGANSTERLIVVIATAALSRVCRQRGIDIDQALTSYAEVAKNISIVPKGSPDVIAAKHLRDAAAELLRVGQGPRMTHAV